MSRLVSPDHFMKNNSFSIITICKNAEEGIERTIKSVISQSYGNVDYIIIDGASTDNTIKIIDYYSKDISCVFSEKDGGVYNAMNKGIQKAKGDFLLFLNAGDVLFNTEVIGNVNRKVVDYDKETDVFHGKVMMYYGDTGDGYLWESGPYGRFKAFRGAIPHPSTFYSKKAFEKNGMFDETYKIAGDYEWLARAVMKNRLKFQYMNLITAVFYKGGMSNHADYTAYQKREIKKLISTHYTPRQRITFSVLNRLRKILGL